MGSLVDPIQIAYSPLEVSLGTLTSTRSFPWLKKLDLASTSWHGIAHFQPRRQIISLNALHLVAKNYSDKDRTCTVHHLACMDLFWNNASKHLGGRLRINTAGIPPYVNPPQERGAHKGSTGELEHMSTAAMETCLFESTLGSSPGVHLGQHWTRSFYGRCETASTKEHLNIVRQFRDPWNWRSATRYPCASAARKCCRNRKFALPCDRGSTSFFGLSCKKRM